jgi:O-antigen/teichoic acid export membrane protein
MNWLLIPRWGITGAASATVITDLVSLGLLFFLTRGILSLHLFKSLLRPFASAIVMGAVLWWLRDMSLFISLPAGIVLFVAGLFSSGAFKLVELSELRKMLKAGS